MGITKCYPLPYLPSPDEKSRTSEEESVQPPLKQLAFIPGDIGSWILHSCRVTRGNTGGAAKPVLTLPTTHHNAEHGTWHTTHGQAHKDTASNIAHTAVWWWWGGGGRYTVACYVMLCAACCGLRCRTFQCTVENVWHVCNARHATEPLHIGCQMCIPHCVFVETQNRGMVSHMQQHTLLESIDRYVRH